jgi:hypothetical protein
MLKATSHRPMKWRVSEGLRSWEYTVEQVSECRHGGGETEYFPILPTTDICGQRIDRINQDAYGVARSPFTSHRHIRTDADVKEPASGVLPEKRTWDRRKQSLQQFKLPKTKETACEFLTLHRVTNRKTASSAFSTASNSPAN